jgi:ABC-2 type transport system permease protein
MLLILPVFQLFIFGYAINLDIKNIPLGVYNLDNSTTARQLVESYVHSGYFDLTYQLPSEDQLSELLDKGSVKAVLKIPHNFSCRILEGKSASVQLILDGSDNNTANVIMGYANAINQRHSQQVLAELLRNKGMALPSEVPSVDLRPNIRYNPELTSVNFMVPGIIGIIIMTIGVVRTSITVVREKERGTMEGLLVSPIKPLELMIGKITPYIAIAFVGLLLIIASSHFIFHVPFRGSLSLLLGLSLIFIAAALGIGLLISSIAETTQVAWLIGFLSSVLPSIILSGFIFPIENMPVPIQLISHIVPVRYFLVILRGIILKGVGLSLLYREAIILLCFAVFMLALSSLRFKKRLG